MVNKNSISILPNCYGCGVCSIICPQKVIKMSVNANGFYQPKISKSDTCTNCGLCLQACSYVDCVFPNEDITSYATWSKDAEVRCRASSGGTGFEIAKHLLEKDYNILAVRYNAKKGRAEHYVAKTMLDLEKSTGSKYLQSYTEDTFSQIKKGNKYLITGTPCQIASLRKFIKKKDMNDDVVLLDFFCHGVPTLNLWNKYIEELEPHLRGVLAASWRNKTVNWHSSYNIFIKGIEKDYSKNRNDGDLFYKFFLGNMCFNKACYKDCKFKNLKSCADIRIGDLWGSKYAQNEEGVTGVLCMTDKGNTILNACNSHLISEPIGVVTEGQLKNNIAIPYYYSLLMRLLRSQISLLLIYRIVQFLRIGTIIKYKLHIK